MAAGRETTGANEPSLALRWFLVGVRVLGLVVALSLTELHTIKGNLPEMLRNSGMIITFAVIFYHFVAMCIVLKVSNRGVGLSIMVLDALIGATLTFSFGPAYLIPGFTLPMLEAAVYGSTAMGLFVGLVGGVFYGLIVGFPLLNKMSQQNGSIQVIADLNLMGVQAVLSVLYVWMHSLLVREIDEKRKLEVTSRHEKELLFEEIQVKTKEVGRVFGEVGDREERLQELEATVASLMGKLETMADELQQAQIQRDGLETVVTELEHRLASSSKKERQAVERDLATMRQRMAEQSQMVEMMRELEGHYRALHRSLHLSDTLLAMTNQLQELLPSQTCVIFLLDEVNGHKELFAEVAASPYTDMFRNVTLQLNEGAPGFAVSYRRALKFDNGKLMCDGVELTTLLVYEKSALVAPLVTPDEVLGAIYLGRPEAGQFSPEELTMLEEYAVEASLALANSLLYQRTITGGLSDPLTRLYNGLYLRERTREEVMRGRRYTYPVSLILLNLDRYGEISGALGQETCDQILKDVAEIIRQATRETDIPARLEGDEFAILLVHSDRNNAFSIGERIRRAIHSKPFGTGPAKVSLSASVGVAGVPHDATNEEQLQSRAEAALQQSRQQGGNAVSFWNGSRVEI